MVSAALTDAISNPSVVICEQWASRSQDEQFQSQVARYFKNLFASWDALAQVPPLNTSYPPSAYPPRSLVRFRCMVQDTSASPEMYLSSLYDGTCGGWGIYEDSASSGDPEEVFDYEKLKERCIVWAITVPGTTEWLQKATEGYEYTLENAFQPYLCKRSHKQPQDDPMEFGVVLKLYDTSETLQPGEVHTFVGILDTAEHVHRNGLHHPPDMLCREESDVNGEFTEIPTLHVLFAVDSSDIPQSAGILSKPAQIDPPSAIKDALVTWLAEEALAGDVEVAQWVLLMTVSQVESRIPPLLPLSLTVSGFPLHLSVPKISPDAEPKSTPSPTLSHALNIILSSTTTLPMSLSLLNGKSFFPISKEEDLHAGRLQLPTGTTVVITDNAMTEGRVSETGLKNLDALQNAISTQTLVYLFPYSSFSFHLDLNFLVLAQGKKSPFLTTDISIPLRASNTTDATKLGQMLYKAENEVRLPSKSTLESFRWYIQQAKRTKVSMGPEIAKHIEDEFVRKRQVVSEGEGQRIGLTSDDLIRQMTIARLLAMFHHKSELTKEVWDEACEVDERKRGRIEP